MALPTLDATFASSADLPRRQMLAKWLVEELGSGSIADYYDLPERYLWAKIAVAAGGPKTEADYISLPKNYAWSDIYNAVAESSGNHTDWSENVALGHIAAAYRSDTGNPENLATYIDWPWRYKVASIITHLATPITYNAVIVSGAGNAAANATWTERGTFGGKPYYNKLGDPNSTSSNVIRWSTNQWEIYTGSPLYVSNSDTSFPWQATFITAVGNSPVPTLTPTNV